MWDDTVQLRKIADALFMASQLLILYGVIHYVVHLPNLFPLHSVRMDSVPQRIAAEDVLQVARGEMSGNLLTVDIERLREALERLPWVRSVSVKREYPDTLVVALEEQHALARWNGDQLVNSYGEVFKAKTDQHLPEFYGPDGRAAEVTEFYEQFSRELAKVGLEMAKISLSERHAWQLRLTNGVVLELGREDVEGRLARFAKVYPYSLQKQASKLKYVDLRYRNGFAVSSLIKQG